MPVTFEAIAIVLVAVLPGYVATLAWFGTSWPGWPASTRLFLNCLIASLIVQIPVLPLTLSRLYPVRAHLEDHPGRVALWAALVFLLVPALGGVIGGWLWGIAIAPAPLTAEGRFPSVVRKLAAPLRRVSQRMRPSMFDYVFESEVADGAFVVVEYADGSSRGGIFGKGSWASTSPHPHGLFLREEWIVRDGRPIAPVTDSGGVALLDLGSARVVRLIGWYDGDGSMEVDSDA
jgi:hypothetical protein